MASLGGDNMVKSKPKWKNVVNSWTYRIAAGIIAVGVTSTFYSNFPAGNVPLVDSLIYWSIYLVCMAVMLFMAFVVVRRQM